MKIVIPYGLAAKWPIEAMILREFNEALHGLENLSPDRNAQPHEQFMRILNRFVIVSKAAEAVGLKEVCRVLYQATVPLPRSRSLVRQP